MDKIKIEKINSAEARSKLRDLIDDVAYGSNHKILMRNEKPMAALISMGDYKRLMELEDIALADMARETKGEPESDFFEVFRGKSVSSKGKGISRKTNQKSPKKGPRRAR